MDRRYVNRIFEGAHIRMDGMKAVDVIFRNCTLEFDDSGEIDLEGCDFIDCTFLFDNEATLAKFRAAWRAHAGNTGECP